MSVRHVSRVLRWHLQVTQPLVLLNQPRCRGFVPSLHTSESNPDFLVSLAGRCSFWKAPPAGAPAPMMPSLLRKSWDVGAVFPRPKLPHIWPMRPPPLLPPPSKAPIDEARGLRRVGFIIAGSIVESHEPGGRRDTPEAEDVADSQLLSHRLVRNTG